MHICKLTGVYIRTLTANPSGTTVKERVALGGDKKQQLLINLKSASSRGHSTILWTFSEVSCVPTCVTQLLLLLICKNQGFTLKRWQTYLSELVLTASYVRTTEKRLPGRGKDFLFGRARTAHGVAPCAAPGYAKQRPTPRFYRIRCERAAGAVAARGREQRLFVDGHPVTDK